MKNAMRFITSALTVLLCISCTKKNEYLYPHHPVVVEPPPTCTISVTPAVQIAGYPVTATIQTNGRVDGAMIDGVNVTIPVGTRELTYPNDGAHQAKGQVSGPAGTTDCVSPYTLRPKKFQNFQKQIKDIAILSDIDILWIVDNSGSMLTHQNIVISNTETFMQQYTKMPGLKWKMGLISTDQKSKPYIGFDQSSLLSYESADPVGLLKAAVGKLGTMGSSREESFTPLMNVIEKNPGFIRKNAFLATIMVTDAPEQSWPLADDVLKFLKEKKGGDLKKVFGYGVFGARDLGCPAGAEDVWDYKGSEYEKYITGAQGSVYPLCKDFADSLLEISKKIVSTTTVTNEIPLSSKPFPKTIELLYKGNPVKQGAGATGYWTYQPAPKNAIYIHDISFATGEQEFVTVKYEEDYL